MLPIKLVSLPTMALLVCSTAALGSSKNVLPALFSSVFTLTNLRLCLRHLRRSDCPRIAEILLAILLFADDIALFSYSHRGLQRQLDILYAFCTDRQLTVNVAKTKALVFEARKNVMPPLLYAGNAIAVDIFKYLGVQMHGTKGLTPAMEYLCKAAKRAMFGLQRRCQQLRIHDPTLKPILCYGCKIWSVLGCKSAIADLERVRMVSYKSCLESRSTPAACPCRVRQVPFAWQIAWQAQAAKYLSRIESMDDNRTLDQTLLADRRLP